MADRNINRLHMRSCPQYGSDQLRFVEKRAAAAFFFTGFEIYSGQSRLSRADGRDAGDQSEVACDAESPRMGNALSVTDDDIGARFDFFKRCEHDGYFPEREQSGDIGKGDREARGPGFGKCQGRVFEDGNRCGRDVPFESDIDSCDIGYVSRFSFPGDLCGELPLKRDGVPRAKVP